MSKTPPSFPHADTLAQEHLVRTLLGKNPELDESMVRKALEFTQNAHRNQFRKSGMPYAEHPIEVAKILCDLRLDTPTVVAGLLHDVVEDTQHSLEELKEAFGAETVFMVDAVTKISAIQKASRQDQKAATYRKLLVGMAKDPRVIMIKLADRLHNLRTLQYMKPEKRKVIAEETLELYAPLTHRFGLNKFRVEMEDLSFKYLHPDQYRAIVDKLQDSRRQREAYVQSVIRPLEMKMNLEALPVNISGRPKHIYSIWQKMKARKCQLDDVFDLFAMRILVETIPECYLALGFVHNLWPPLQSRFKDYIASPKSNLYQSLHTTVIGPEGKIVEIQIRTKDQDETAEKGFAAHWAYKYEAYIENQLEWLDQLVKTQNEITDSDEFLEFLRVDLKPQEMVIFTPGGDSISLPHGATVLDFAFAVHTDLGYHCIGARIEEQVVGLETPLNFGSTVHVLRSPNQEPTLDWLQFARTTKAKSAIRRWHRTSLVRQAQSLGKAIWQRELRLLRIPEEKAPKPEQTCAHFDTVTIADFFERLGRGRLALSQLHSFLESHAQDWALPRKEEGSRFFSRFRRPEAREVVEVGLDENLLVHFSTCCHPLPGDSIAGFLIPEKGIEVHMETCSALNSRAPGEVIPVVWKELGNAQFLARVEVRGINRDHLLEDIISEIGSHGLPIERASVVTNKDTIRDRFTLKVSSISQLEELIRSLRQIPSVKSVSRI